MSFEKFVSKKHVSNFPEGETNILKAGTYDLKVTDVYFVNDHMKSLKSPVVKDKLPEWKDPTDQMAVVFWHKDGVTVRRFNANGFVRFSELEEGQRKDYDELGSEGYAVHRKTKVRVVDTKRTESCMNIVNQFYDACGLPEGSTYKDLPNCMVQGTIVANEYGEKTFYDLQSFKKIGAKALVEDDVVVEDENY